MYNNRTIFFNSFVVYIKILLDLIVLNFKGFSCVFRLNDCYLMKVVDIQVTSYDEICGKLRDLRGLLGGRRHARGRPEHRRRRHLSRTEWRLTGSHSRRGEARVSRETRRLSRELGLGVGPSQLTHLLHHLHLIP